MLIYIAHVIEVVEGGGRDGDGLSASQSTVNRHKMS